MAESVVSVGNVDAGERLKAKRTVTQLLETLSLAEEDKRRFVFLSKKLQRDNQYLRESIIILRNELYTYWHPELVEQKVMDPSIELSRRFIKLLRESERLEL